MKINKTRMICEAAIFIAMAEILSLIKLYEFPNGGSITLEMLPIILFAARYGCGWGSLAGLVYGTITYLIGNKFSVDWTTIICDYFIAFVALGFGAGLAVFMFTGFVKSLPLEIEEAAAIDGCGPVGTFFRVVLPMLKPTMISVGVLEIMWVWNDYLLPSLVLDINQYRTIPIHIQYLKGSYGTVDMGATMALIMLSILPVIIFYLCCQKHIIKGVAAGAVKG